jgi:hypothetical protein
MTTTSVSISEYNRRTITLEVTGMHHQTVSRTSPCTVKVPYSSLAQTLQSIQRRGGTVIKVAVATLITPSLVTTESKKPTDTAGKPFKTSNTRSTKQKRR